MAAEQDKFDRYTTDRNKLPLHAYSRLYPPRGAVIRANSRYYLLENVTGEGFLDYVIVNFNSDVLPLFIELDGRQMFDAGLTVRSIQWTATGGLGISGWYGYFGCQVFDTENARYGLTIVPVKDTLPFYSTLRVWIDNPSSTNLFIRKGLVGWRIRQSIK